ncbi:MAG: hypothetical protein PHQ40_07190 [Anaerolineaceae bacterium]|nr:hypothetical protein [Anaerolineaceae bacterium]
MNAESTMGRQPNSFRFYVLKLIRLRWLIFITGFKRARLTHKLVYLAFGILILAVLIGTYLLTSYVLGLLNSPEIRDSGINLDSLIVSIPPLIISGSFLVIMMFSFGVLLQALYLANDMDYLLSSPIPIRAIFLTKLLHAILPNVVLIMVFALPILFSLGISNGYNVLYFAFAFVTLVFLSLAAAGISSLLVMAVVHFLPAKRVAEILAFVAAIFFMAISQLGNLTGVSSGSLTTEQIIKSAQVLTNLNQSWSPLSWGGLSLVELGQGHWLSGIIFLALTLCLTGSLFWVALNAAEYLYYTGWASIRVSGQPQKHPHVEKRHTTNGITTNLSRRWLPSQVRAILYKDLINLSRDLRFTSQMVMPLIMGIVFMVMVLRGGNKPSIGVENTPELLISCLQSAQAYASMLVPLFVGSSLVLNLALLSFSIEGKSFWILQTSPVNARKQLVAKFIVAYIPSLIICWFFLFAAALFRSEPISMFLYEVFVSALILAGLNGVILSIGVRGANLDWDDPRRIYSMATGLLGILVAVVYLLVVALFFLAPTVGLPLIGMSAGIGQLAGLTIGGLLSLVSAVVPLVLVKTHVYRIGED